MPIILFANYFDDDFFGEIAAHSTKHCCTMAKRTSKLFDNENRKIIIIAEASFLFESAS